MRFPVSLRWSSYIVHKPPRGVKTQNGRFGRFLGRIALCLKKVCYKVSLCENCQRQNCKAFIGLTIRAKIIGGGDHFYENKVQLALKESPLRAFQWAQDNHHTLPLSPRFGGSKTQNGRFPFKIALCMKKVCYKVSLCENYQWQSCKAFIGLTVCAKIIGGASPST